MAEPGFLVSWFSTPRGKYTASQVELAIKTGQRPTATILRDYYAGYRDYSDPFWKFNGEPSWTDWDYALAEAWQARQNFYDESTGQPRWMTDDPDIDWKIGVSVNFAEQQLQEAYEKLGDDKKGYHLYLTDPYKKSGEFWTIDEWIDNLEREEKQLERSAPVGGHKPTAHENAKRKAAQQERIRKALESADAASIE